MTYCYGIGFISQPTENEQCRINMEYRNYLWRVFSKVNYKIKISNIIPDTHNVILNYHSVSDDNTELFGNIPVQRFYSQMKYLKNNYTLVDLPETVNDSTNDDKNIAITFDDGYLNFHQNVFPILRELEIPATVFINPSFVENNNEKQIQLAHSLPKQSSRIIMNSTEIRELVNSSLVTVGNHTYTHANLLDIDDKEEMEKEIIESKQALEKEFGTTVDRFSYPYGGYNQMALDVVRRSHKFGVGVGRGLITSKVRFHRLPRVCGHQSKHVFQWELTDLSQRVRNIHEQFSL